MKYWPPPLRVLLPATLVVSGLLALLLVTWRAIAVANHLTDERSLTLVHELGALVSQQVEAHLRHDLWVEAQRTTHALSIHRDLDVAALIDADDRVVFATQFEFEGQPLGVTPLAITAPAVAAARATGRPQSALGLEGDTAVSAFPVALSGVAKDAGTGVLVTRLGLARTRTLAVRGVLWSSAGSSAVLLTGVLLFWWLAIERVVRRRVETVMRGVARIGRGDLSTRTGLTGNDEVAGISRALDTMAAEIARSTHEVRMNEQRFRELIEHGSDLVMTLDHDGRLTYASPSVGRLLGRSVDDLRGRMLIDLVNDTSRGPLRDTLATCLAHPGATTPTPVSCVDRASGVERRVELAIRRPDAPHLGDVLIANGRDVTERTLLEATLRETQRMEAIGRLAGGVAHDFNNLLTVILGTLDVLDAELRPNVPLASQFLNGHHDDLVTIRHAADRAAALTAQLLAFSRNQVLAPQLVDLNALVADHASMLGRLIGAQLTLRLQLAAALPPVEVDPGQLSRVVINLVVNARDAMPSGGQIVIETAVVRAQPSTSTAIEEPRQWVALRVTDCGVGMDAQTLCHVFDPFFTTKQPGKGTGLGLSMALGMAQQSGGTIEASSTPGGGSTFTVLLPPADAAAAMAPLQPAAPVVSPLSPIGATVLLVEDEDRVRSMLSRMLAKAGLHVLTAADGMEALAVAAACPGPIDLVLSDVSMPNMDGPALVKRLAIHRPDTCVVLMSGNADQKVRECAGETSVVAILAKPFSVSELLDCVRQALSGRQ